MAAPLPLSPAPAAAWVALAVFAQPHGVSGRVKVKSFTDPVDDFAAHAPLTYENGTAVALKITGHTQGMAIVEVEGITNRDAAEGLRGRKIGVSRAALPVLDTPNAYYIDDLIGMEVTDTTGAAFGTVSAVANYGAGDILEITKADGSKPLFAFTHRTFPEVDATARHITIDPPQLLEARTPDV